MKLKIPPAIVFMVHLGLVWVLDQIIGSDVPGSETQRIITQVLGTAGVAIILVALGGFRRAGTTVNPMKPAQASRLVQTGIYRYTRNPMYLALLLILLAWITWKGVWPAMLLAFIFVWYMTEFQIKPEEQALQERFGEEYLHYKQRVRRWL